MISKLKASTFSQFICSNKFFLLTLFQYRSMKIVKISYSNWQKMGFSKGTLHYMKQNAQGDKPFTMNKHIKERLNEWDNGIDATM